MVHNPLYSISVIIPVYGVEKYIEKCARSLFEQSLQSVEYIFVDDCSPDESITILKKTLLDYPDRQESVTIVSHSENKGLPYARKTGFSHAHGEYIICCDSDDWVDKRLYELMYDTAKNNESDVVVCDCLQTNGVISSVIDGGSETDASKCLQLMQYRKMWWSLCNKLFRASLFDNTLNYPQQSMGEDMCLCLQLFHYARKIDYVKNCFYNYYLPDIVRTKQPPIKALNSYEQLSENLHLLISTFHNVFHENSYDKGFCFLKFYKQALLEKCIKDKGIKDIWRNGFDRSHYLILRDSNAPFKMKIKALLIILHLYPFK